MSLVFGMGIQRRLDSQSLSFWHLSKQAFGVDDVFGDGEGEDDVFGDELGLGDGFGEAVVRVMIASEAEARALVVCPIAATAVFWVNESWQVPVVGPVLIVASIPDPWIPPESGGAAKVNLIVPFSTLGEERTLARKLP